MTVCYVVEKIHSAGDIGQLKVWKDDWKVYTDVGKAIRDLLDEGFKDIPRQYYPRNRPNLIWHGRTSRDPKEHPTSAYVYSCEFVE